MSPEALRLEALRIRLLRTLAYCDDCCHPRVHGWVPLSAGVGPESEGGATLDDLKLAAHEARGCGHLEISPNRDSHTGRVVGPTVRLTDEGHTYIRSLDGVLGVIPLKWHQ